MLNAIYQYLYTVINSYYEILNIEHLIILVSVITALICLVIFRIGLTYGGKDRNTIKKCSLLSGLVVSVGLIFIVNMSINHNTVHYLLRTNYDDYKIILKYGETRYYSVNKDEWLRQILEVLAYIPLGIVLMKLFKRKGRYVIGVAFCISLTVELVCSRFNISGFYWQTALCNTVGTMLGVSLFELVCLIKDQNRKRKKYILFCWLPILCVLYFGISYALYYSKDYGNIYPEYYRKLELDKLLVDKDSQVKFDSIVLEEKDLEVGITSDEIRTYAEKCFSIKGKEIDDSKSRIATEEEFCGNIEKGNVIYSDKDETVMFIAKTDGFYFIDKAYYEDTYFENKSDYKYELLDQSINSNEIKDVLRKYGIIIDGEAAGFEGGGRILYKNYRELIDGQVLYTYINAVFFEDKEVGNLELIYQFIDYDYGKNSKKIYGNIAQPDQAYDKLCQGECYAEGLYEATQRGNVTITVKDYRLEVQRDNFGCLQYVYRFDIEPITAPDGIVIDRVFVPAMKNYYED